MRLFLKMWAVTILCTLLPYAILAQVDIHNVDRSQVGYTIEKSDPNAGEGEIYTSTYQLQKFFEEERGMIINTCNKSVND